MKLDVRNATFRILTDDELIDVNGGTSNLAKVTGKVVYVLFWPGSWIATELLSS
ncbi:MAG: hypothetical protein AAGA64_13440 [Bacteroidota bacterium]